MSHPNSSLLNSADLFLRLFKKRKLLFIILIVSVLASVLFTSPIFIIPLYKSSAIVYPVNTGSISEALLGDKEGKDLLSFGDEEESEQLLQLLNSSLIRDHMIDEFDLLNHYQIKADDKFVKTKLYKEYKQKFKFSRTEYMAVNIQVMDHDPMMAAKMAKEVISFVDEVKTEIQQKRAKAGLRIIEEEYEALRFEVESMEDSLTFLREKGVHDYESQAEMINQQLAIEIGAGNQSAVKRLEKKLEILAEYGGPYVSLRNSLEYERLRLSGLKARYQEAKVDAMKSLPQSFVVSEPIVAERKSYPPRTLFVLGITASALLFSILLLFLIENIAKFREKLS